MVLTGVTDNQGNTFVTSRLLSTKYPLALMLMQLTVVTAELGVWLDLKWWPRERNVEADQLSNEDFTGWDLGRRIQLKFEDLRLEVVQRLAPSYRDLLVDKLERKRRKVETGTPAVKKLKKAAKVLEKW
jgi:hypothetical protein